MVEYEIGRQVLEVDVKHYRGKDGTTKYEITEVKPLSKRGPAIVDTDYATSQYESCRSSRPEEISHSRVEEMISLYNQT